MKKIKRFGVFALAALMAVVICACGGKNNVKDGRYIIGICQIVEHPALDAATKGFKDALVEKLGDKVAFEEKNAQNDIETCATIVNGFISSDVDLILANATPALQAAAAATSTIPILGTSVTEYGVALDIKDFKGTTGYNVSGTSDLAPLNEQAGMIKELFPKAEKVAMVYCSAEANSLYQVNVMKEELEKLGIESKAFPFADSNDIINVATSAADYADVVYLPTDNTVAENNSAIYNVCMQESKRVPVIAGEMAYEILVNGADIANMEIEYAPQAVKKYDEDVCKELGIEIPEGYVAIEK